MTTSTNPRDPSKAPLKLHQVGAMPDNRANPRVLRVARVLIYTHYPGPSLADRGTKEYKEPFDTDQKANEEASADKVAIKGE